MHAPPFVPHTQADSSACPAVNVAMNERLMSIGTGAALLLNSLVGPRRMRPLSFLVAAGLLYRGMTGHCHAYEMLGIDTTQGESTDGKETSPLATGVTE
jgi:hypothetical protein